MSIVTRLSHDTLRGYNAPRLGQDWGSKIGSLLSQINFGRLAQLARCKVTAFVWVNVVRVRCVRLHVAAQSLSYVSCCGVKLDLF